MRVLTTADPVGGVWTYALDLCAALRRQGAEVALATMGAPLSAGQRAAARAIPGIEIFESGWRLEWMEDPWPDVDRAGEWLLSVAAAVRPGVVHLNQLAFGHLPWDAPTVTVGHSCVLSWWRAVRDEEPPGRLDEYRRRVERGLRRSDVVVTPTASMGRAMEALYGPLRRRRVIANGRPPGGRRPGPKAPFVFTAGRLWDPAKNVSALDRAAERIEWPVYAAGDDRGPSGESTGFRRLRTLGRLSPAVLDAWLSRASIFALPARYEPFGLTPLEAAQAGCALVLGDIDSLREVWGNAALYVDPDDPAALASAVNGLAGDPVRRRKASERALRRARRFDAAAMAREYLELYESRIESGRRPRTTREEGRR